MDYGSEAKALKNALRGFHKALVAIAMSGLTDDHGNPPAPLVQMRLLTDDPRFDWLRSLSKAMSFVDHLIDTLPELDATTAQSMRRAVEDVVGPTTDTAHARFRERYAELVPDHPRLGVALGDLRRALTQLPDPQTNALR